MKKKNFKAPPGKFVIVVEDPLGNEAGIILGVSIIEENVALKYAREKNAQRKTPLECVFWVYNDAGECINPHHTVSWVNR